MTKTLKIEGMSCAHCVRAVTKALTAVSGVIEASVDLESKTAVVETDDAVTDGSLRAAVEQEDFEVTEII